MDRDLATALGDLARRGWSIARSTPLAGDLSVRRYIRLDLGPPLLPGTATGQAILALYPSGARASAARFAFTSSLLSDAGLSVPSILERAEDDSWMLVSDLGLSTVFELPPAAQRRARQQALALLPRIAGIERARVEGLNPPLDASLLRRELRQSEELFLALPAVLGEDAPAVSVGLDTLACELGRLASVPCHRDLMVRNLVALPDGGLAVLDHQDLRLGPPTYDLASLLNDSLFVDPQEEVTILAAHLPAGATALDYHRAAAQRTLKAVGTFAAAARRGVKRHLPLVAPTLAAAERHLRLLPELAGLAPRAYARLTAAGRVAGDLLD